LSPTSRTVTSLVGPAVATRTLIVSARPTNQYPTAREPTRPFESSARTVLSPGAEDSAGRLAFAGCAALGTAPARKAPPPAPPVRLAARSAATSLVHCTPSASPDGKIPRQLVESTFRR